MVNAVVISKYNKMPSHTVVFTSDNESVMVRSAADGI